MFGQRRRLRHIAVQMLLVWVFALTTGIVNACVVAPEARHAEHAAAMAMQHDAAASHAEGHHAAPQTPAPHARMGPCAKFCADESNSAPVLKLMADPHDTLVLAGPPTLALAAQAALVALPVAVAPVAPVAARIPIPIAYLRLTR